MENLVETHKSGSDMELHHAVAMGQMEIVKLLVEKKHALQKNHNVHDLHMAAITGNLQLLKYFITERNCSIGV